MAVQNILTFDGLHTAENGLSQVPSGSLVEATNVMIRTPGVLEPRRGQEQYTTSTFGSSGDYATQILMYKGTPVVTYSTGSMAMNYNGWTAFFNANATVATSLVPANNSLQRMKGFEAQDNLYFNTTTGVYRLDALTGYSWFTAGGPYPAETIILGTTDVVGTFLAAGYQCAYRVVIGVRDANGLVHYGPPSGRVLVSNTNATIRNVTGLIKLPPWVTDKCVLRLFRTSQFLNSIDPGDEMQLVEEVQISSADVAAGYISLTDITPDAFRGENLYTNPNSGEGILQANYPPPWCLDMTAWAGRAWYANTKQPQRFVLELLGTGPGMNETRGVQVGDLLYIADNYGTTMTLTGVQVYPSSPGTGQFEVWTSSTPTLNVANTARSIVAAINNLTATYGFRAVYLSGPNDPPGKILIERVGLDKNPFYAYVNTPPSRLTASLSRTGTVVTVTTVSSATAMPVSTGDWIYLSGSASPDFPAGYKKVTSVTSATKQFTYSESGNATFYAGSTYTVQSVNGGTAYNPTLNDAKRDVAKSSTDAAVHRLYYSKAQEPEAVPLLNYLDIGTPGRAILRIFSQRDRLLVFKEEGTYAVTGQYPFAVDLIDDALRLTVPDSVAAVGNTVFAVTNQGVVAMSVGGNTVVSGPIADQLQGLTDDTTAKANSFGIGHPTDMLYSFWPYYADVQQWGPVGFVYNIISGTWTQWTFSSAAGQNRTCGVVSSYNDRLYMGALGANFLLRDKRYFNARDYSDALTTKVPTAASANTITVTGATAVSVGDIAFCDNIGAVGIVTSRNTSTGVLTISGGTWTAATGTTVSFTKPFTTRVQWAPFTAQNPSVTKQVRELHMHFRRLGVPSVTLTCETDICKLSSNPTEDEKALLQTTWTNANFSVQNSTDTLRVFTDPSQLRMKMPQGAMRGSYHHITWESTAAWAPWALNGIAVVFDGVSDRTVNPT